jgi:Cell wall-associated hydrolases (invasion-associated proteins)
MCPLVFLIILVGGFSGSDSTIMQNSNYNSAKLTPDCEKYRSVVIEYAEKYDMEQFVDIIMAVMMQETGGLYVDVMQSSESEFNAKYPREPNGITDSEYSIYCGVRAFKQAMEIAECESPADMERLKLGLQGYNFGPGYVTWAIANYGGYSKANAEIFSKMMALKMEWSSYGDINYVDNVLRYYSVLPITNDADINKILEEGNKYMGMPYVYGGASPETSFDCSGFIYYVYKTVGYNVSRMTAQGFYNISEKVEESDVQIGDLVFFEGTYGISDYITHIGIYVGNGNIMHFGDPSKIESISNFGNHFVGYGRLRK